MGDRMKKIKTQLPEIKLVGITTRTNSVQEFSSDPAKRRISATVQKYFHGGLADKIVNRKNPGTTLCVYTNYESDFMGDYTYFIGEEVTSFEGVGEGFECLTIPAQQYVKFTNEPKPMPAACIDMWQSIWNMSAVDLGGERSYVADFEVYDQRSADQSKTILDIYIGIKK